MVSGLCFLYCACLFGSGHVGSLVGAQEFLVTAQFPNEGSNPDPLHWELRVLVTRPPGKSLYTMFKSQNVTDCNHAVLSCVWLFMNQKWQPTPIFLPGKFHGQRSLVGYSPWDHKESDTTLLRYVPRDRIFIKTLIIFCESLYTVNTFEILMAAQLLFWPWLRNMHHLSSSA